MNRRNLLKSMAALPLIPMVGGCASIERFDTKVTNKLVTDLKLFGKGLSKFIDNEEVKAKTDIHDFEKLIIAKVAVMVAVNKIDKEPHNVRNIIANILTYLDDAIIVTTAIMAWLPIPAPFPTILTALKTILPLIIAAVRKNADKIVYTGMTPDQARAFLATI